MSDPFDVLSAHVRNVADAAPSRTNIDELVAQITLEHHRGTATSAGSDHSFANSAAHPPSPPSPPSPPRRWGSVVVGVALCAGVGAGAVVTAAVIDHARVENSQTGVLCHASIDDLTSSVLLPANDDPAGACSQLWRSGALPLVGELADRTDPPLVQCTGSLGLVEVFPGDSDEVCTGLGMAVAAVPNLADVPLHQLQLRVASDINAQCLTADEAQGVARSLLDELGFESWTVVPRRTEGLRNGCSMGYVGSEDGHALYVNFTPTSQ